MTGTPASDERLNEEEVNEGLDAIERTFCRDPLDSSVAVADGFGIRVRVEKSHLEITDGIGPQRRTRSYSRADRSLQRLVVLGDGFLTFQALRWCRATGTSAVLVDDDGVVLASSTPGLDDARLRRAQATAMGTETGLQIVRDLLRAKLSGQARVARDMLASPTTADTLESWTAALDDTADLEEARAIEAQAAQAYFSAWPTKDVLRFITKDTRRVPLHWRAWNGRRSAIRGRAVSNQRAERPLNSILNYLYRLAEVEAHLAVVAVGLDPGLGLLHADYPGRDSLVLDLLEVLRPEVEAYVLRLVAERTFRKSDFHEMDDGHVRLLAPLSHELAEAVMPMCARAVAPHAEAITHALLEMVPGRTVKRTPLTSARRRQAVRRVQTARTNTTKAPLPTATCHGCGTQLGRPDATWCAECLPAVKQEAIAKAGKASAAARRVRKAAGLPDPMHSAEARAARGAAIGRRDAEALAWDAAHPGLVVDRSDFAPIHEALTEAKTTGPAIARATGLSKSHAEGIRTGRYVPHARHWPALAELAGVPCPFEDGTAGGLDVSWWREAVVPALASITTTAVSRVSGLSSGQASKVRRGLNVPHPRHWHALAELAGVEVPAAVAR